MTALGWLDLSDEHRKRVMMVMDMFKEQGVIDELGLGTIRDSISDFLFPGTSTIQTRAKYFLIIPRIFSEIERKNKFYGKDFLQELEKEERNVLLQLDNNEQKNIKGIIGRSLRSKNPKRKPSSIYWNGLRAYKILNFQGSIADYSFYIKYHSDKIKKQKAQQVVDSGNVKGDDRDVSFLNNAYLWSQVPYSNSNNISINLDNNEAEFLRDKIIISCPNSLLAYSLQYLRSRAKDYDSINEYLDEPDLPDEFKKIILLASNFNFIMSGALIRYNYLIQRNREDGNIKQTQEVWDEYWNNIKDFDWSNWDIKYLWHLCPRTNYRTKDFVTKWIELIQQSKYNHKVGDNLIKSREFNLKGPKRSRLYDKTVAQKQAHWTGINVDEKNNVSYLSFRWGTVKTFINDIVTGINNNAATK